VPSRSRLIFSAVLLLACVTASLVVYRRRAIGYGSNTNASDAVDAPMIEADASAEDVLDVGVQYTFPASDPVAVAHAYASRLHR
jgi:hypothetical protein